MTSVPLVVIGGSAGALEPLREIIAHLPQDFPAAVLVVVHASPDSHSHLAEILNSTGSLPAQWAQHQGQLQPGHIWVAPSDHHLLVSQDRMHLSRGPKENRSRPSIDVLFRSAASTYGVNVIGVLLSGMLDDGTSGLWAIQQLGGHTIVQHPEEAAYNAMPLSAVRAVPVDDIVRAQDMAPLLQRLLLQGQKKQEETQMNEEERRRLALEVSIAGEDSAFEGGLLNQGPPSTFTCPECHGVMIRIQEGRVLRFRCHTGHAYTAQTLQAELRGAIEAAFWNTVRALEEDVMLLDHLAKQHGDAKQLALAEQYRAEAEAAKERARRVRQEAQRSGALQSGQ
ncbi:chemotaxis protein CheB [Deinococcus oregonensis]|uniref:protein-glutamate methylesterase n=1 Tax=Deinococcus oregonensis TaxID=1805970 RepID=A0ABV6AVE2_9DEIO